MKLKLLCQNQWVDILEYIANREDTPEFEYFGDFDRIVCWEVSEGIEDGQVECEYFA